MRIVNQPAQDAISRHRIADLFMPARDRQLRVKLGDCMTFKV
jgi:hypothetical protein